MSDERPPLLPPAQQGSKPPFDRERFVFKTLAVVICTQLLIYSLAAGVCGQRRTDSKSVTSILASAVSMS